MNAKQRHERVSRLFREARALGAAERATYLERESADDTTLAAEVLALIREDEGDGPLRSDACAALQLDPDALSASEPSGFREDQVVGDFRLLRLLGRGGMGQVWEAEQSALQRSVALKLVPPEYLSARTLAYFQREARAGGQLAHPGIVAVYDSGESNGVHWIAQELVPGGRTLRDLVRESSRRDDLDAGYYQDVAELVARIADALQTAHDAGVIHRDVKPSNVLLTDSGTPKVADFGLARTAQTEDLSATGDVLGTHSYMSPEQVEGKRQDIDHRTDVFSLGIVLYELLALRRPFEGDTSHQITAKIVREEPRSLRSIRSRIPRELDVITGKALEKSPARRYPTASALASDLRRYLANEPIHARPPGRLRRVSLWAKRHPTWSIATAVAAVFSIGVSGLSWNLAERNAQLQHSNAAARTQAAQLAYSQGLWRDSLEAIEEAEATGVADDVALTLLRARCHLAQYEHARARELLDGLQRQEGFGAYEGSIELLAGWLELGGRLLAPEEAGDPLARIRHARSLGLPAADAAIADALLAATTSEAIEEYARATQASPVDYIANISRLQLLTLAGRLAEADQIAATCRRLFPADPSADAMQFLRASAAGDFDEQRAKTTLGERLVAHGAYALLKDAGFFLAQVNAGKAVDEGQWDQITSGATWFHHAYLTSVDRRAKTGELIRNGQVRDAGILTPAVLHVGPAVERLLEVGRILDLALADGKTKISRKTSRTCFALAREAVARHDEGWLRMVASFFAWLGRGVDVADQQQTFDEQWAAADTPSLIPDHKLYALALIANVGTTVPTDAPDRAKQQLRSEGRRAALRLLNDSRVPLPIVRGLAAGTQFGRDHELAVAILDKWGELDPGSRERTLALVRAQIANEEWPAAIRNCEFLLIENPSDEKAQALYTEAVDAVSRWVRELGIWDAQPR